LTDRRDLPINNSKCRPLLIREYSHMIIKDIEAIPLNMPYRPELAPHLIRSGMTAFNNRMTLYRVELEGGAVGYGDQLGGLDDVSGFIGRQAIAGLVEIRHPGVQMACYDAVGRALDLPVAGWLPVPEGPGLGVEVDQEAVEMLRRTPVPETKRRIATVLYPDGTQWHFADETQRHEAYHFGNAPGFVRGVRLETREDDGSADFADLFDRCSKEPVLNG